MDESKDKRPWDRQEGETDKAYRAFIAYRNMGADRSCDAAYAQLYGPHEVPKRSPPFFKRWCRDHSWVARASAWDTHLTYQTEEAFLEERLRRNREQAELAHRVQLEASKRLLELVDLAGPKELGALARIFSDAIKTERMARGLVGDISQLRHADAEGGELPPLLTDEEKKAWVGEIYGHLADIHADKLEQREASSQGFEDS